MIVNPDTRVGAVKQEARRALVLATMGGGLLFTWLGHLMAWTPLGFAVHGTAGLIGGYFVGSALSRAALGVRRQRKSRSLVQLPVKQRVISSLARLMLGVLCFYGSYLWAVGVSLPAVGAETLFFLMPATAVFVLAAAFIKHLGN